MKTNNDIEGEGFVLAIRRRQICTFVTDAGETVHVDVDGLLGDPAVAATEIVRVPVSAAEAKKMLRENAVDIDRVGEMLAKGFEASGARRPVLFCNDGTSAPGEPPGVFLADGRHRYFIAALVGAPHVPARILPGAVWRPHVMVGLPKMTKEELISAKPGGDLGGVRVLTSDYVKQAVWPQAKEGETK